MTEKGLKYLSDILQAIELIEEFTESIPNYGDYVSDLKTQSAVERQLGIIGEAVNKFDLIEPDIYIENSRKIVGFRNRLIHAYDAVDTSMVWVITKRYLPLLKEEVSKILSDCK
ncbi:MAG: DUF86 domain-containing protein [Breznakibacter sp.]|nr:DUF86 domain-containing protein [Breznakibacter sp.]